MEELIDNCMNCMFSHYKESNIWINDLLGFDHMTCNHENSPYYDENVNDEMSCRQFIDSNKYFLRRDREEKLNKINERR